MQSAKFQTLDPYSMRHQYQLPFKYSLATERAFITGNRNDCSFRSDVTRVVFLQDYAAFRNDCLSPVSAIRHNDLGKL